jgi:CSLREA domain-containing protein
MRGIKPLLTAGALAALVATWTPVAAGKSFEVTRHNDPVPGPCKPNDCSLREAILAANARAGQDTIVLADRSPRYELAQPNQPPLAGENEGLRGDLDIGDPLTVRHPGKGLATIDANGTDRVLQVLPGATTKLVRIKLTGGDNVALIPPRLPAARTSLSGEGGGILAEGPLRLVRSSVVGNTGASSGGGIDAYTDLTLLRSRVSRNRTIESVGGGIEAQGTTKIIRSAVIRNRSANAGGGVTQYPGTVRIVDSTVAGNRAASGVGGVYLYDASGSISGSTIAGNSGGGSIAGGIELSAASTMNVVNSTVTRNDTDSQGGGINVSSGSSIVLRSVTIARNVADSDGDALGSLGGGIYLEGGSASLVNTIVALNKSGADGNDCAGAPVDSEGGNLVSVTPGCTGFEFGAGDFVRANPKLGKLTQNGGPTETIALKKGSPAIGKAVKSEAPKRDQRGVKRDNKPDIGAFER